MESSICKSRFLKLTIYANYTGNKYDQINLTSSLDREGHCTDIKREVNENEMIGIK